ncbi:hypothetical protein [Zunongwangia sp. HRR-M8]|uniref:hypothetical protein n=1 Tax=Zunongwangia sp. HRR-M8 TaxID=3015170 RepID=UPI0022DD6F45|nr:hypothetical protein [Zunongwangia sp. HRR-M8]WBL23476.1 hypothetical protein PBT89_05835 [Zunongwangia sp. HRR-M8]
MRKLLFSICVLLFAACDKDDANTETEPSADIQAIMDKGITIDTIALKYATIYQSSDNFPIIKPNPINQFVDKNEILVYFDFISSSRDSLLNYYSKIDEENYEKGIVVDYALKYNDRLESISIEVKKNNGEFFKINDDSNAVKLIPTPEIESQHTFAKYEFTIEEFITRCKNSFPEYFVLAYDDKEMETNSYIFRTTFRFNNNKKFVFNTQKINF